MTTATSAPLCQVCKTKPMVKHIYDDNNKATPACNTCYMRNWRHTHRDEWNAYRRERYAKKRNEIQDADYDALMKKGGDEE